MSVSLQLSLLLASSLAAPGPHYYSRGRVLAYRSSYRQPGWTVWNSADNVFSPNLGRSKGEESVIAMTVRQSKAAKAGLRLIPQSVVDGALGDTKCWTNLVDVEAALDASVGSLVAVETELNLLAAQDKALKGEKTASGLVIKSAEVLDTLAATLPKLNVETAPGCGLRELADTMAALTAARIPGRSKAALSKSARALYATSIFLTKVTDTSASLAASCPDDDNQARSATLALADILGDLSDLYGSIGSFKEAVEIRARAAGVKKVVTALEPLSGLGLLSGKCGEGLADSAARLRELGESLDDTDVQELAKEVGIELDFGALGLDD